MNPLYEKAKDIIIIRRTADNKEWEEYPLVLQPLSLLVTDPVNDVVCFPFCGLTAKTALSASYAVSASYAITSSYSSIASTSSYSIITYLTQSTVYQSSASWASSSLSSSHADTASYAMSSSNARSASFALASNTSSIALKSNNVNVTIDLGSDKHPVLYGPFDDGGVYPGYIPVTKGTIAYQPSIDTLFVSNVQGTASQAITASNSNTASFATSASYAKSASFAITTSYVNASNVDGIVASSTNAINANTIFTNIDNTSHENPVIFVSVGSPVPGYVTIYEGGTATYNPSTSTLTATLYGTASWANSSSVSITSSFSTSASYAKSASYALTASNAFTSSYALNSVSVYNDTCKSASWASSSIQAQFATQSLYATSSISASYLYGIATGSNSNGVSFRGTASCAVSSSNAVTASYAISASYSVTSSYTLTASFVSTGSIIAYDEFQTQFMFNSSLFNPPFTRSVVIIPKTGQYRFSISTIASASVVGGPNGIIAIRFGYTDELGENLLMLNDQALHPDIHPFDLAAYTSGYRLNSVQVFSAIAGSSANYYYTDIGSTIMGTASLFSKVSVESLVR